MKIGTGTHVLVTGAGKRIGRALSQYFLDRNVNLSAHYHESKNDVEELSNDNPKHVLPVQADLRLSSEIDRVVLLAVTHFGPVHILINCAARFYKTPSDHCTEDQWNDLVNTNLRGQFFMSRACAKVMKEGSVILHMADVYGETGLSGYAPYSASKGGLLTLTKALAKEWAPRIRVNAISPGPILAPNDYDESQKLRSQERTLLKRWGDTSDICHATRFLIECDYITGFNLRVDGGRLLA